MLWFLCFFFGSYFLKLKNALRNEKTAKLVFIFKYMRLSSWMKNYIMYVNLNTQIYSLKNKFYSTLLSNGPTNFADLSVY